MSLYEEFVELHVAKKSIEADLAEVKDKIKGLEGRILEEWGNTGLNSVKTSDGRTLWLDHKFWASAGGDTDAAVEGLRLAGMGDLVKETVNRNSLSALIREYASPLDSPEELESKLPDELRGRINVTETTNVRVRGI